MTGNPRGFVRASYVRANGAREKLFGDLPMLANRVFAHFLAEQRYSPVLSIANELRERRAQPIELSNQDRERAMLNRVERIVWKNPALAVSVAHRLGWDVCPH